MKSRTPITIAVIVTLFLLSAACAMSRAQAVRWDVPIWTTNQSQPIPGGFYPVVAIPNATIAICSGTPCTLATTYTNASAVTPCPTTAQLTRGTSTACYATSDSNGGAGAWLRPGNYQYTVSTPYATTGPYPFGVDAGGAYLPLVGGNLSGGLVGTSASFASSIFGGPTIDIRYNNALCDWNGSTGTDDTPAVQATANTANALYIATGQKVGVRIPASCVVAGIVTSASGVNFVGPGTIIVPDQTHIGSTAVHHPTLLFNNADSVGVDGLNINVITPCPGNDATCAAIAWLPAGSDSAAHAHVAIRNTTITNANWGILVGYYGTGTGSLTDVDISHDTVSSPTGSYSNADGIHIAGRVSMAKVIANSVSNRNDAAIAVTQEGSGTYIPSGTIVADNDVINDRVGLDCSGCTNALWHHNIAKTTIASPGTSNPALRIIYYNGYPFNVLATDNYLENNGSVDGVTAKVDPILGGQVSWPDINVNATGNTIAGSPGVLYVRGKNIVLGPNNFMTLNGALNVDYDGADNVATEKVSIGGQNWMASGTIGFGAGCGLYANVSLAPQNPLPSSTVTVTNQSCIGTQTFSTPGDLTIGSGNLTSSGSGFTTVLPGSGAATDFLVRDPTHAINHLIVDSGGNVNVPVGWIQTAQYLKFGGGGTGGIRNASGVTVIPGAADTFHGSSSTHVQMSDGSGTPGNCPKFSADGGLTDSGGVCGAAGGGAFSTITAGTNTAAAMIVGTGGSLSVSGSGTINANQIAGGTAFTGNQGNGTLVQHSTGAVTTGNCAKFDANGNTIDSGAGCGSGTLPSATDTFNGVKVNGSGTGTIVTTVQGGTWEGVINGGADNAGSVDAGSILNAQTTAACSSATPVRIHLAAGTYKVNSGWTIAATSTTCKNMVIEGDGSANTVIQSNCSGAVNYVLGWINSTSPAAEHFNGPTFRHLTIKNTGGAACAVGLLLSQTAMFKVEDMVISGFAGQTYATGTIASTGSTVTGTGTTFTAAMVHGFIETTSGNITTRSEVCAFGSATSLTLCATAFPSGNIAGGTSYGLAYGGDGLACDPGFGISGSPFTQYGTIKDVYAPGNLIGIHAWGTTSASSAGCSRIQVTGNAGYISPSPGSRVTDAVGIYLGKHSDTWEISSAINNSTVCIVNDSGHANWINGAKCENGGSYAPVTTCNGGVATQACTAAWEVSSDTSGNGWNTTIDAAYAQLVGTVYQYDNSTGAFNSTITAPRDLSGQYTLHYSFYGTTTCPGNASGIPIMIMAYDCNHQLVTQTVN